MSRPEFPIGTPLPVSCIRAIREEQEYYDRDPERYEQEQREREEMRLQEEEEMRHQECMAYDRMMEDRQAEEDQLPF